ncbi:ATPase 6, plasma membrane-type-like [Andrographis paniculata]|uniref:ATPase 6, plasma membrane-type-like n=1 Tax=Andrographis paniculata TaxID=175694 RepID=UPI0021E7AAB2|nr:ATPase 6, plasma membrane-type-like [Andrographis paniculata]
MVIPGAILTVLICDIDLGEVGGLIAKMVRNYDNWERLVEAVMHREQFRQLSLCSFGLIPPPLLPGMDRREQIGRRKMHPKRRNPIWKAMSIFVRRGFSLLKGNRRDERELWEAQRTLENTRQRFGEVSETDVAETRTETERLQKLHTLKGHIESVLRAKGIDLDSIPRHYTI